jgi:DNA-binding FrmR family transcriptional regulator
MAEWIHDLLEGAEAEAFSGHLSGCQACAKALESERSRQASWKAAVRQPFPDLSFVPPPAKAISTGIVTRRLPRSLVYALAASAMVAVGLGGANLFSGLRMGAADSFASSQRASLEAARAKESEALSALQNMRATGERVRQELFAKASAAPVNIVVNGPASIVAGAPSVYRIETLGPDGLPRQAKLSTRLRQAGAAESFVALTPRKTPDGAHELVVPADAVLDGPGRAMLRITADVEDPQTRKVITVDETVPVGLPPLVTHLATDRRLYLPGETVRFRSLTLERATLKPAGERLGLSFILVRPDGAVVDLGQGDGRLVRAENGLLTNGPQGVSLTGIGTGEVTLEADAPGGEYTLRVEDAQRRFAPRERKFLVHEYQPQRLAKELVFGRRSYGPGDTVEAMLKGTSATGEPLTGTTVEVSIRVDDRQVDAKGNDSGASIPVVLDPAGKGLIRARLPVEIRRGDVTLTAIFTDGANRETLVKPVPVALRNVAIEFFPEGGELVHGSANRVYFSARTPLGKPADIRGRLLEDGKALPGEFTTFSDPENPGTAQGLGVIEFTPAEGKSYSLEILSPEAGRSHPLPKAAAAGTGLRAEGGASHGDAVAALISAARPARHLVGLYCRGRLLDSKVLEPGKHRADLKPADDAGGVGRVTVFRMESGAEQPQLVPVAERLVWLPTRGALSVGLDVARVGAGSGSLSPGDRARLSVSAKDSSGKDKAAIALLSVVDLSNIVLADERSARSMPTHFLIGEEVRHAADLEYADFLAKSHPQARKGIDLLLGVQGWRRFAEQDPAKFQRQFPVESANYLMSAGQREHRAVSTVKIALERELRRHDDAQREALKPASVAVESARAETEKAADAANSAFQTADAARRFGSLVGFWTRLSLVGGVLGGILYGLVLALSLVPSVLGRIAIGGLSVVGLAAWLASNADKPSSLADPISQFVRNGGVDPRFAEAKSAMAAERAFAKMDNDLARALPMAVAPAAGVAEPPVMMGAVMDGGPRGGRGRPMAMPMNAMPEMAQRRFGMAQPNTKAAERAKQADGARANDQAPELRAALRKNIKGERRPGMADRAPMAGMPAMGGIAMERDARELFDPVRVPDRPMIVREYSHARVRGSDGARSDFSETLLWRPATVLGEGGATAEFDLCDSVTRFQAVAMVHTADGELAQAVTTFDSKLPLSLSVKVPFEVTASDVVKGVVSVEARPGTATVALDTSAITGAVGDGAPSADLALSQSGRGRRVLSMRPGLLDQEIGFAIGATGGGFSDSVRGKIRIVPEGFPVEGALSDRIAGALERTLRLPKEWVPGSLRLEVDAYPSTLGELAKGLDGMLREPHGCFEQTSSSNYPNTMILGFIKASGRSNPELEAKTRELLSRGYSRLVGFECMDTKAGRKRGFEWFGAADQQHEALTAYGLMQFSDMKAVGLEAVDGELITRTREFLISRRDGQGGYIRNARSLDQFGGAPQATTNAYITWALSETGPCSEISAEINAVKDAASGSADMYLKALAACCLANAGRQEEAEAMAKSIAEAQNAEGMVAGGKASVTRSMGQSLDIETTALSAIALMKLPNRGPLAVAARKATDWIGRQKDGLGSYGATQSTVLALKALAQQASLSKGDIKAGEVKLVVGDKTFAKAFPAGAVETVSLAIPDAERVFKPGDNRVRFEITGGSEMPASLAWRYHTLVPPSSPKSLVDIRAKLDREVVNEGESVRLEVAVSNKSDAGQGMAIAVVGLPAGLSVPADAKQMTDLCRVPVDGTRAKLSQWEVRGRDLVLYWRDMAPRETFNLSLDLEARVPGVYRGPAGRAYLYYTPEHRTWIEPVRVTINPAP